LKYTVVNKNIEYLKNIISVLPELPGIYQYFDSAGRIIYVGKAKNLKQRVSSYFLKQHEHRKTALLVQNIADIKHMVVETEEDALFLENSLIKKYQPRYNIRLKDDKTYPWICVKNEFYPRVFKTRNVIRDGSKYFGPYTSYVAVNTLLDLFRNIYKLRTCNYNLSDDNIKEKKYKVCLEYHLGNCQGACENLISAEDYNVKISEIINILKGNISGVIKQLTVLMDEKANSYKFEEAHLIKIKLDSLKKFQSRSTVVSAKITDVDVFSIEDDIKSAFINYLKIIKGAIIQTHTIEIGKNLNEDKEELLLMAIIEIRQKIFSNAKEIIVPFKIHSKLKDVKFIIPKKGEKKHLLELSQRNAKYYKLEREKNIVLNNPQKHVERLLEKIQKDFKLKEIPIRIECFDNSNLQGTNPVAACVVFEKTRPLKKEYRHYNIKTVDGPNDFASMEEIIFRRYKRILDEDKKLPQLIVIDGGKGQLTSAVKSLEKLGIRGQVSIIGIAKKLEEIYFPDDQIPVFLDKNSESLKVIQHIRDEAHRFGISFHRQKRSVEFIHSELDKIKGIGPITIKKLLQKFKSVSRIKQLEINEIENEIGYSKAQIIFNYFHQN